MSCKQESPIRPSKYCKQGTTSQFLWAPMAVQGQQFRTLPMVRRYPILSRNTREFCDEGGACTWWVITLHPLTANGWLEDEDGNVFQAPQALAVPINNIIDRSPIQPPGPLPPGTVLRQHFRDVSGARVALRLQDKTGQSREIVVDLGAGLRTYWYGQGVEADLLLPGTQTQQGEPPIEVGGSLEVKQTGDWDTMLEKNYFIGAALLLENLVVEAQALPVDCCPSDEQLPLTLSELQYDDEGTGAFFERPAGAKKVSVKWGESGAGDPTILWAREQAISFGMLIQQPDPSLNEFVVPGDAVGLVMLPASTAQALQVTWSIEP